MPIGLIIFLAWMALEVVVVAASIAWGYENGQWKNIEEAKYRMLQDIEPQPWPGRDKTSSRDDKAKDAGQAEKKGGLP